MNDSTAIAMCAPTTKEDIGVRNLSRCLGCQSAAPLGCRYEVTPPFIEVVSNKVYVT